jgi:hypothetical protein
MTEPRPILAFGPPSVGPIPRQTPRSAPAPRSPNSARQGARVRPQFQALADALAAQRAAISDDSTEPDPEHVVVFDLAGTVDEFMRAVSGIAGLEFLVELEEEPTDPDEDFYFVGRDGDPTSDQVPETLYMVMSNAEAVAQLIRLFDQWQADPGAPFPRGLAPLKSAFVLIRSVRRWGPEDRVRETGLLDAWREDLAVAGQQTVRVEVELWFRANAERRASAEGAVTRAIESSGGSVIDAANIHAIGYHAVLAELPRARVETVLNQGASAIELLTLDSVMFVSPSRPMTTPATEAAEPGAATPSSPAPVEPPRVALLDGLPMANHATLNDRLVIDDPDAIAAMYPAGSQWHGTGMASLICHGDLSHAGPALSTKLYARPIMQPDPGFTGREITRPTELLVDLIHRCFVRMFEGDGTHPPTAPSVRIINLSIGDPARAFTRHLSPLAKLLDWLSHKYNVLVLVSAGNHDLSFTAEPADLVDSELLHKQVATTRYLRARQLGVLSPAESVNALTVGALHSDGSAVPPSATVLDVVPANMPAPYGAVGFGYRRSVKPDILLPAGKQLYQRPVGTARGGVHLIVPARHSATGPGLMAAAPSASGDLARTTFVVGTSGATALASRTANAIFDILETPLTTADDFAFPDPQFHPVLAKALLAHSATWGDAGTELRRLLDLEPRRARSELTQQLGYGAVDLAEVANAARHRVLLIGAGAIGDGDRNTFSLPMPAGLAASTEWRRLTITLAWLSPVNPRSRRHRQARLRFHPPDSGVGVRRTEATESFARNGTLQHEVLEGTAALAFARGDAVEVHVDCRVDAGRIDGPVRYGLAVSIAIEAAVKADIYSEIRQELRAQVRARSRVAAR